MNEFMWLIVGFILGNFFCFLFLAAITKLLKLRGQNSIIHTGENVVTSLKKESKNVI